ncbi:hypothetical protein VTI74DRAFT_10753 [Chaetomium olivicolor]
MESFFNDFEKRFILGEMLKVSDLDVGLLVDFIKSHGIKPDWMHMQLPGGRNLSQCLHAAEIMFNAHMPPPVISPLKRKSLGDLPDYASKRRAVESPGDVSPRGLPLSANFQPSGGAQVSIQPRPNGYPSAPLAPSPTVSTTPYNPIPPARRRGRPPKAAQPAWQVSTGPKSIAPSPAPASQPLSPGLMHSAHQTSGYLPPDPKVRKKALPEIAPRPAQGPPSGEPAVRSPAVPGGPEYQNWREETSRREYYHLQSGEPAARERPASTYAPILPRPLSPYPPSREPPRPASTEPRHYRETPPAAGQGPARTEGKASEAEPTKT